MALGFGTQPVSAMASLAGGQDVYARDILQNASRQRQMTQAQAQGDIRGLVGQGANPFAAQRQAGRQRFQAQAQNTVAANSALEQRFQSLNQQADQERLAQEARGRQMLGSMLQTAGSVASLIPGVGTAVGGGAQAVGGMLGGGGQQGGGGIGGAVQGLMGAVSGQPQQAPMQRVPQAAAPVQGGDQFGIWHGPAAEVGGAFRPQLGAPQNVGAGAVAQSQAPGVALTEEQRRRMSAPSSFGSLAQGGAWWRNGR